MYLIETRKKKKGRVGSRGNKNDSELCEKKKFPFSNVLFLFLESPVPKRDLKYYL